MKNFFLNSIVLLAVSGLLNSCGDHAKTTPEANTDSISSTDSLKALKESSPNGRLVLDTSDNRFIIQAVKACLTESRLGQLALTHAENKRVRNFGGIMIRDIKRADKQLTVLAKAKHAVLPVVPDDVQQKTIDSLNKMHGRSFDRAYVNFMIADHKNYIILFDNEAKNSADKDIKAFANKALISLNTHLDAINMISNSMH